MREMYTPFKRVRRSWLANGKQNDIGALHKDSVTSQYMFSRLSQWQGRLTWLACQSEFAFLYRVAQKERNSRYSRFSGLCSNQQLLSSLFWIEHLFPIIITSRSSNLVENFLFYETFLMDCHFRDLPDFQSFEARWQINGKSQKWQSIRNYS